MDVFFWLVYSNLEFFLGSIKISLIHRDTEMYIRKWGDTYILSFIESKTIFHNESMIFIGCPEWGETHFLNFIVKEDFSQRVVDFHWLARLYLPPPRSMAESETKTGEVGLLTNCCDDIPILVVALLNVLLVSVADYCEDNVVFLSLSIGKNRLLSFL